MVLLLFRLSSSNQGNYRPKHLETFRNWFACFWTYLSGHRRHTHIWEQSIRGTGWAERCRWKEARKERSSYPIRLLLRSPQSLKTRGRRACITHLPTAHQATFCRRTSPTWTSSPRGLQAGLRIALPQDRYCYRTIQAPEGLTANGHVCPLLCKGDNC